MAAELGVSKHYSRYQDLIADRHSHVLPGMQEEATAQLERMLYG